MSELLRNEIVLHLVECSSTEEFETTEDAKEYLESLSNRRLERLIEKNYHGGLEAFTEDVRNNF